MYCICAIERRIEPATVCKQQKQQWIEVYNESFSYYYEPDCKSPEPMLWVTSHSSSSSQWCTYAFFLLAGSYFLPLLQRTLHRSRRGKIRTGSGSNKGRGCWCCHAMVAHKLLISIIGFLQWFMLDFSARCMSPMCRHSLHSTHSAKRLPFGIASGSKLSHLGQDALAVTFAPAFLSICSAISLDSELIILRGRVEWRRGARNDDAD